ncbi:hypothetical protein STVA_46990 [Allostella vacuolata]|nr:hypothetical protein STVA_46990 [Stella vacuolata]
MNAVRQIALSGALFLFAAAAAQAAPVEVSFGDPARFTDAGLYRERGAKAAEPTLQAIHEHLTRLGARHLGPRQALRIEIRDIDLAGRYEPWRIDTREVRVMRDITWPRIALSWVLEEDGVVVAEAEETLRDLNYLSRSPFVRSADPLPYERAMLDDWFRARIVERRPAAAEASRGRI